MKKFSVQQRLLKLNRLITKFSMYSVAELDEDLSSLSREEMYEEPQSGTSAADPHDPSLWTICSWCLSTTPKRATEDGLCNRCRVSEESPKEDIWKYW